MVLRKRKWAPANTSSEAYDENGFQTVEFFNASTDRNRQAPTNKLPTPWPFFTTPGSAQGKAIVARIEGNMKTILEENKIPLSNFEVSRLKRNGFETNAKETLIIRTTDDQSESIGFSPWWYAACDIQELLDKEIRQARYDGKIRVEIWNEKLMDHNISSVVPADSEAFQLLTRMRSDVIERVRKSCLGVRTISFVMRGAKNGEKYPTVLVGITPGTVSNWNHSYGCIIEGIEEFSTNGVNLEFLPELILPISGGSLECKNQEPRLYREMAAIPPTARNGSSIGPRGALEAGSLGVWVWLKEPDQPRKMAFLTCYHVICTGQLNKEKRLQNDKNGIGLDGAAVTDDIIVDYPAPYDSNATEKFLTDETSQVQPLVKQTLLDTINRYREYPGIGRVAYASGNRKKNKAGKSMDWAIVICSPTAPSGQNLPPLEELLRPPMETNGEINFNYYVQPNEVISVVGKPVIDEWVLKIGRTTRITTGNFNGIKTNIEWNLDHDPCFFTDEYVMLAYKGQIVALGGDSGSMIMNQKKEWIGMVTAASTSEDSAYFTCAQDIIDDVKDRTGCEISLPK